MGIIFNQYFFLIGAHMSVSGGKFSFSGSSKTLIYSIYINLYHTINIYINIYILN